jgi:dTDP-4-amino-4,6-dideoxygalactose transaminase
MKVPFLDLGLQHAALRAEAIAALTATYDATRFCLGKDVDDFERNFAATLGYPRALGMNSGTAPLHVACMIAGFKPGDEVLTTPFTFISSAWGISYVGATPVFCDVEEGAFNLDPAKLEVAITPRTRGIVVVHLFGQPARMEEIIAIARRHGLYVIEDCAQAVGRSIAVPGRFDGRRRHFQFLSDQEPWRVWRGRCVRREGRGCPHQGETHSRAWLRPALLSRYHWRELPDGRLSGCAAEPQTSALGEVDLAPPGDRRPIFAEIKQPDVRLPDQPAFGQSVFHQFTIRHPRRDALREHLARRDVGTDLIYPVPLRLQKCYAGLGSGPGSFPVAEQAAATCVRPADLPGTDRRPGRPRDRFGQRFLR